MWIVQKNGVDWVQNSFEIEFDVIINCEDIGVFFLGWLGLVIDVNCVSVCFDFVDVVLCILGVIYLGEVISVDINYLDVM